MRIKRFQLIANDRPRPGWALVLASLWALSVVAGCGTTKQQIATEQLLASDAVDRSVAHLDFAPLAGSAVYLDTQYVNQVKGTGFVNAEYIISSLRQQLFAHGCLLQDTRDQADVIVEPRVGTLGNDGHEINYGISANGNALNTAAAAMTSQPMTLLPDISLARRDQQFGAAKIAVFAYDRETKQPLWQSGVSVAFSNSKQTWIFGAGPFQSGTIYEAPALAGSRLKYWNRFRRTRPPEAEDPWLAAYRDRRRYGAPIQAPPGGPRATGELATQPANARAASYQSEETTESSDPDTPAETPPTQAAPPQGASATLPTGS